MNFCDICGFPLTSKYSDNSLRPFCSSCNQIKYLDPKVAVVVLVTSGDQILLVKRAIEPNIGEWSFPSGYVDRGEHTESASIREVKEETNIDVSIKELIGVYSGKGSVILIVYAAVMIAGKASPNHEVSAIQWFPSAKLPDLPFPHDNQIIKDYLLKFS